MNISSKSQKIRLRNRFKAKRLIWEIIPGNAYTGMEVSGEEKM